MGEKCEDLVHGYPVLRKPTWSTCWWDRWECQHGRGRREGSGNRRGGPAPPDFPAVPDRYPVSEDSPMPMSEHPLFRVIWW